MDKQANTFYGIASEYQRLELLRTYNILDTPPERAFTQIVSLVAAIFSVPIAFISFIDSERVWIKASVGIDSIQSIPRDIALCAKAILQSDVFVVNNNADMISHALRQYQQQPRDYEFYASIPLRTAQGYNIGTLCIIDLQRRLFTAKDRSIMRHLADLVIDELDLRLAIQQRNHAERLRSEALHDALDARMVANTDPLTRLNNRRSFESDGDYFRLCVATGHMHDVLLAILDVDGLKAINDTLGHQAGDHLLQKVGECLSEQFRLDDYVYRIGGDEYAVVLTYASTQDIIQLQHRFQDVITCVRERSTFIQVSASIGIASLRETDCQWIETVRLADARMYEDKTVRRRS